MSQAGPKPWGGKRHPWTRGYQFSATPGNFSSIENMRISATNSVFVLNEDMIMNTAIKSSASKIRRDKS